MVKYETLGSLVLWFVCQRRLTLMSLKSPDIAGSAQRGDQAGAEAALRRQETKEKRQSFERQVAVDKAREVLFLSDSKEENRAALAYLMAHDPAYVEKIQKNGWLPSLE